MAGRGQGDHRGRRRARCEGLPARAPAARRPAGENVEAGRHLCHHARGGGGSRPGLGPFHHADAGKNDAPLDFDLAKVLEQSRDNPVFYVQYAHARARSVLRNAAAEFPGIDSIAADLHRLTDSGEIGLIKLMAGWPRIVESAAEAHEPHRIAFYLYDLAAAFHALWNRGKEDAALRFLLAEDPGLTAARVAMLRAMALTIASGLGVFGVEPAEEMR